MLESSKRSLIIETATELFSKFGYHAVGVDYIIKEAEVSKKTLYKHFSSKENLIIAVLKQRDYECQISLKDKLGEETDALKKLELIFDWHNEWFNTQTFTGCLFAKAATEFPDKGEEIHKIATNQKQTLITRITEIVEELLPNQNAENIASVIMMLLDGATLSAQIMGNQNSAKDAWDAAKKLLI